jgi:hypothetical protein
MITYCWASTFAQYITNKRIKAYLNDPLRGKKKGVLAKQQRTKVLNDLTLRPSHHLPPSEVSNQHSIQIAAIT